MDARALAIYRSARAFPGAAAIARYGMRAFMNPRFRNFAARRIQSAWRSAKARYTVSRMRRRITGKQPARARIGNPIQRQPSRKRNTVQFVPVNPSPWQTRSLYQYDLTGIPQGDNLTQRTRDIINLKGFKICASFQNKAIDRQLFVNYALLNPKNNVVCEEIAFFRSYGDDRGIQFNSPNLTAMDYHCRPINTDQFNIISHKRFKLASANSSVQNNVSHERRVMRYIKCKRQLRYTRFDVDSEFCSTPIYFVWWCDFEGNGTEVEPQSDVVTVDLRILTYYSNPTP